MCRISVGLAVLGRGQECHPKRCFFPESVPRIYSKMRLRGNRFLFKFPFREFGHKSLIKKARNGMKVFLFSTMFSTGVWKKCLNSKVKLQVFYFQHFTRTIILKTDIRLTRKIGERKRNSTGFLKGFNADLTPFYNKQLT